MATATKPSAPVPPSPAAVARPDGPIRRALDAIYRFCASVKLAVVSLLTLAAVLAYGTFYESRHGTSAVQEEIYKSTPFALLLAVLGVNIFCAASIRYPWKRRQTGFVVTHIGLLILLAGSFISKQWSEDGQVGYLEGEDHDVVMAQPDNAILRLRKLDPATGKPDKEYEIPFRPGPFAWGPGRVEDLSRKGEPFKVVVKGFLPASARKILHEPAPAGTVGVPMLKLDARAQPPGSSRPFDVFETPDDPTGRQRWFIAANEFGRISREVFPARFVFQFADSPELVDDFLHPPADPNTQKLARLHYTDLKGQDRVFDWPVDGKPRTELLPGSDLTVTFVKTDIFPDPRHSIGRDTGDTTFPVIRFTARKGADGPELDQVGFSTLPAMARFLAERVAESPPPLIRVGYFTPPLEAEIAESKKPGANPMLITRGVVEIMGTPDGKLYHRVFGLDGLRVPPGPLRPEEDVLAFGGVGKAMSLKFRVEHYLPSGRDVATCVPVDLPPNQIDNGYKAALVALTVEGETREFWVRRTGEFEPAFGREGEGPVLFKKAAYDVAYDLARKPLGFRMKLEDFQSDTDPGSSERSSYVSTVLIDDPEKNLKDERRTIWMNNPMTHRGYTFYQSNFEALKDADDRPTGQFRSVFQVRFDPAWQVMYLGSLLVIFGAFLQFYMRSGVFSFRHAAGTGAMPRPKLATADEPL